MSGAVKTRHGGRNNRFNTSRKKVDANQRKAVAQDKLMYLEEDFFEDPDKMAEFDDHDVFEEDGKTRKLKNEKRIIKRVKKECQLKRNLNLRKIIQ